MPLDPELLKKARTMAGQFAEAERRALLARADYHTALRRLHLAGASLREIAEALALSHQRVQQIVNGAGGTWWRRMWRTRNVKRDAICTFCGRPPSEVAKLIAGPDVYICDGCVALAEAAANGGAGSPLALAPDGSKTPCSFCGKRADGGRRVVAGASAAVCNECMAMCRDILDNRAA